ncbi:MAG: CDP-alcohol phosphatidyltransferase [Anaerolineales bacterium]|nr:CDP-alcohol phosphatidyltransferase [Anaerolineales bacterium]
MPDIEDHKRVHDMLLGPLERPTLQFLAGKMPAWVNPDMLLGFGLFGSLITLISYWLTNFNSAFLWLASLGFMINWFGDSLDGTLARYRKIERPKYGFFVDHTADSLSTVMIFVGLGLSAYVRLDIALLACIGYLLMMVLTYINTIVGGEFKISYGKVGPTELRIFAVIVNMIVFFYGNPLLRLPFGTISAFDLAILAIAVALFITFIVSSIKDAARWSIIDPGV